MSEAFLRSESFPEGFLLTITPSGLRIETVGEVHKPLKLDREKLAVFGLHFREGDRPPPGAGETARSVLEAMGTSLNRILTLLERLPDSSSWETDRENLKWIRTLLCRFPEEEARRILAGEKAG